MKFMFGILSTGSELEKEQNYKDYLKHYLNYGAKVDLSKYKAE